MTTKATTKTTTKTKTQAAAKQAASTNTGIPPNVISNNEQAAANTQQTINKGLPGGRYELINGKLIKQEQR